MIKIPDIIQLNDWNAKKFLRMIIAIQLLILGSVGFDFIGLEIPILRQVIGFVYLTFVPGIILLRLLNLHKLGVSETVLLSSGLSISFLMFSGFFINLMLSFLNIDSPLSFWHVVLLITTLINVLLILSYKIDKFYLYELPPLRISRSALYLMLLPVLSIVGTYFVNFHNNNIFLMILIVSIALIPFLVALNKITPELYPLAIVVIAISLLFHRSLISMFLTGWDIHGEYYFYKLVVNNAYWDPKLYSNLNAMLSIVILPAVYSYFLQMDGAWVFKIVYPIIFSLVPLGLYCVYKHQIKNNKIAFFSVFFFMSFFTFFSEMLSLARQEIAELFFVLFMYLMIQDSISKNIRNILMLIFGVSLITSHYGLSYIVILLIVIIYLISTDLIRNSIVKYVTLPEFNLKKSTLNYFVAFYIVFAILWYINFSSSSVFKSVVDIGDHIYTSIITDFFNPESRDASLLMALGIIDPVVASVWREIHRDLQLLTQLLIIIGFFKIIIHREFSRLKAEYFYLIVACMFLLLLSVLPKFASSVNMTRIYHIALLAISPLFTIGGFFVIEKSINMLNIKSSKYNTVVLILFLVILTPYFLFNTGFVYEITNDSPISMSLGMERMKNSNISKVDFYNTYTPENDVYSARWYKYYNPNKYKIIYADTDSRHNVLVSYGMSSKYEYFSLFKKDILITENELLSNYYIYLSKFNVCDNSYVSGYKSIISTSVISPLISNSSRIYSNGCGEIYEK